MGHRLGRHSVWESSGGELGIQSRGMRSLSIFYVMQAPSLMMDATHSSPLPFHSLLLSLSLSLSISLSLSLSLSLWCPQGMLSFPCASSSEFTSTAKA